VAALLPGQAALAAGTPSPSYAFGSDAQPATGAATTTDAQPLDLGATYKSSLPAGGKFYYRLALDAASDAYVSVTAVPRAGATVATSGGIRVSLQDANSRSCSVESAYFGASRSPRPIVAWGERKATSTRTSCKGGGPYYVVVERIDGRDSSPDTWDLELVPVSEPRVEQAGEPSAPGTWNSESPQPLTGEAEGRQGGAGFDEAEPVEQGVWSADIAPGQTLFYAVPVDWGRQIHATAELGSTAVNGTGASGTAGGGYVPRALTMSLYNPARIPVDDIAIGYSGTQKSASLDPVPPADYSNRYDASARVRAVRFAGFYYLALHLSERMAEKYGDEPLGVTLRVRVDGTDRAAPAYEGQPKPRGLFEVTAQDREAATEGGGGAGEDAVMTVVAGVGIGTGTLLLATLGAWTVVARRRGGAVS
jgi:hypothetical protein